MRNLFLLMVAVLICGCGKDDLLVDTGAISLPAEVRLHLGQSVLFPREGYTITFEQVTEDSRCPIGVQCVWAGDGAARLKLRDRAGAVEDDTLHTTLNPKSLQFRLLNIRLKMLQPYPIHMEPLDSLEYAVTLEIEHAVLEPLETK